MRILVSEAAVATDGVLHGADTAFDGASFDSRSIRPGELFVAIVADRDGHDFVNAAEIAGASAAMVSSEAGSLDRLGIARIVVPDTSEALMKLAGWARQRLDVPVVGVTGSVGKTSTKDLTAAALAATRSVVANERSFNNEQGLPVTILGAPDDAEVMVLEMGMRGFGEITRLCAVAQPTVGVVTAVAESHTERLGGIDGVAIAKRELIEALPASGTAILNADDERVAAMAGFTDAQTVTFGRHADVSIERIEMDALARPRVAVSTPWGDAEFQLAVTGRHMAMNAAAAIAVAGVVTGEIDGAVSGLEGATISGGRMQLEVSPHGALIINDAYNANPDSTGAALRALAEVSAERRIAVLGPMAELDDPVVGHRSVTTLARDLGIELVAVGTDLYGVAPLEDVEAAVAALEGIGDGTAVLIKASNSAGLWRVAEALVQPRP